MVRAVQILVGIFEVLNERANGWLCAQQRTRTHGNPYCMTNGLSALFVITFFKAVLS